MMISLATESERDELSPLRGEVWKGALTLDQFSKRNHMLYGHPFGRSRMKTFVLRDKGGVILSSLDVLDVRFLLASDGVLSEQMGMLIASVFTPSSYRAKGYASRLITNVLDHLGDGAAVLYSDIEASFYERFGFRGSPVGVVGQSVASDGKAARVSSKSLPLNEFLSLFQENRRRTLGHTGIVLYPDLLTVDWVLERYRYFSLAAGNVFPSEVAWEIDAGTSKELVLAAPDYLTGRLDGLWLSSYAGPVLSFLSGMAESLGLKQLRYWSTKTERTAQIEFPMVRWPTDSRVRALKDSQLIDWW